VFTAISYLCLSGSFSRINEIFGIRLRRRDQMEIGFVAFSLNNLVSVGGLAGYSLRLFLLRRRGMAGGDIVGASLVHSYANQLMMMSLLPVGLVYILVNHPLGHTRTGGARHCGEPFLSRRCAHHVPAAPRIGATPRRRRGGLAGATRVASRPECKRGAVAVHHQRGFVALRRRPSLMMVRFCWSCSDWAMSVLALGACFLALRTPVHPGVLLTGFAVGRLGGFSVHAPGGLGAQEGSMAGVYVLLGVGYERPFSRRCFFASSICDSVRRQLALLRPPAARACHPGNRSPTDWVSFFAAHLAIGAAFGKIFLLVKLCSAVGRPGPARESWNHLSAHSGAI
jgi:uncharacterized membrane protein YbhN (UPF0104 family)